LDWHKKFIYKNDLSAKTLSILSPANMKILNENLHFIFILVQMKHRLFQENNPYFFEFFGKERYGAVSQ
jgi:hypothetical protein